MGTKAKVLANWWSKVGDKDACRIEWFAAFVAETHCAWGRGRQKGGVEQ